MKPALIVTVLVSILINCIPASDNIEAEKLSFGDDFPDIFPMDMDKYYSQSYYEYKKNRLLYLDYGRTSPLISLTRRDNVFIKDTLFEGKLDFFPKTHGNFMLIEEKRNENVSYPLSRSSKYILLDLLTHDTMHFYNTGALDVIPISEDKAFIVAKNRPSNMASNLMFYRCENMRITDTVWIEPDVYKYQYKGCFVSDTIIGLVTEKGYYLYNLDGELLSETKGRYSDIAKIRKGKKGFILYEESSGVVKIMSLNIKDTIVDEVANVSLERIASYNRYEYLDYDIYNDTMYLLLRDWEGVGRSFIKKYDLTKKGYNAFIDSIDVGFMRNINISNNYLYMQPSAIEVSYSFGWSINTRDHNQRMPYSEDERELINRGYTAHCVYRHNLNKKLDPNGIRKNYKLHFEKKYDWGGTTMIPCTFGNKTMLVAYFKDTLKTGEEGYQISIGEMSFFYFTEDRKLWVRQLMDYKKVNGKLEDAISLAVKTFFETSKSLNVFTL